MVIRRISILFLLLFLVIAPNVIAVNELDLTIGTNFNGIGSDFSANTNPSASLSFDGYDLPALPTLVNTSRFFSTICTGGTSSCSLSIDAWPASKNPRVLNLTYSVNPSQTGTLDLSWSFSNPSFLLTLKDYGSDSLRTNQVGNNIDMSSQSSYEVTGFTGTTRYFTLTVVNVSSGGLDTTPPGTVNNLKVLSNTSSSITWTWNNPTDNDFAQNIIYIQGINVQNTSNNQYISSGLSLGTWSIRINTKDNSGNVNYQNITDTKTLYTGSNPPPSTTIGQPPSTSTSTSGSDGGQGAGSDSGGDSGGDSGTGFFNENFFGGDNNETQTGLPKSPFLNFFSDNLTILGLSALVIILLIAIIIVVLRVIRTAHHLKKTHYVSTH